VSEVEVWGVPARFRQADDKLIITPRWPIPKLAPIRVEIEYAGRPDPLPDPTTDGAYDLGWITYRKTSHVVSEPIGASTFYPANDEPTDKATFSIEVTVPAAYTAVANGALKSVREMGGKRSYSWVMRQPMTTWLATVQVNKFRLHKTEAEDGTPIRVYTPASVPPADVVGYALAGKMFPFFERRIGQYPFDSYGSVVVEDPATDYALETQAMSTFPLGWADELVVAHELAHQWFGNSVSAKKWEDLWLAEGPATYFEMLWPYRNDPAGFDAAMLGMYDEAVADGVGPAVVDAPDQMFTDRTYVRGALTLYALRLEVGDRTFFRILRRFLHEFRGRNASSADFIRTAVRVSGDGSVRDLLEVWLYEEPIPDLPGAADRTAKRGPVPDIVGLRCGGRAHRGAPAACGEAAGQ
jgi:aminopeptidase N